MNQTLTQTHTRGLTGRPMKRCTKCLSLIDWVVWQWLPSSVNILMDGKRRGRKRKRTKKVVEREEEKAWKSDVQGYSGVYMERHIFSTNKQVKLH